MTKNRLNDQTSPYLLQHADNPVHWQSWGPEALAMATNENRPILLSVGYAACHWCHVMAHESFEDEDTALIMNELFVNIKVDREERPDIDAIYQHALMLLGEQGGWPLTMFLTPDGEPFWGGTYFPPDQRYGRPAFKAVLRAIAEMYATRKEHVTEAVASLKSAITELSVTKPGGAVPIDLIDEIAKRLTREFDKTNGGIGGAPKFPNPSIQELLWRAYKRNGNTDCRDAVILTLTKMSNGGIYDHLGGGYARYSTDAEWLAPHFEKMLYDNAQLIDLLTAAWQETHDELFKARVAETIDWVLREMVADGGGFAATLDADSEGVEGKFYVWNVSEIEDLLGEQAYLFNAAYDARPGGNWEGHTILNRNHGAGPFSEDQEDHLAQCRKKLFDERTTRIRPGWDDKVLADWNGMMIAAMANAGAVFGRPEWNAAAERAFAFVTDTMEQNGRMSHSARAGRAGQIAMLDDYANMIRAAVTLHETTGNDTYVERARGWIEALDEHFLDEPNGGYFFTADDAEALIVRRKSAADNATPSGNGIIAEALTRMFYVTGEDRYRQRAQQTITAFSGELNQNFFPYAALLNAAEALEDTVQIVIIGERGENKTDALLRAAFEASRPMRLVTVIAPDSKLPDNHPAASKTGSAGAAFVCVGPTCSLPITDPAALKDTLNTGG